MKLIDKAAVVAEIENLLDKGKHHDAYQCAYRDGNNGALYALKNKLDTLEVKEEVEYKQPEYSCFETTYQCGKKPRWNIGDILAYYEFYSDREGEYVLGKVTKAEYDEEQCDWFYTLESGRVYDEQSLLEEETYKKN